MLSIGNKKYRNLQEQVGYNTECIKKLDEYLDGIKVEDKLVVIESDSGTFTDEELVTLSGPLAFISNGSRVWMKDSETLVEFVYKAIDIKADEVGSVYYNIGGSKIIVNRETGSYNTSFDTIITIYNKSQIDSIIANVNAVKADKAELALKANISGQAFTGAITAPSIIQNMNGFSIIVDMVQPYAQVGYCSVVQNGNKLTIVLCGMVNLAEDQSIGEFTELMRYKILMPSAVGSKVVPLVSNRIDQKYCKIFSNTFRDFFDVNVNVYKDNDTQFKVGVYGSSGTSSMVKGRDYAFRVEETFLLSDNLAS